MPHHASFSLFCLLSLFLFIYCLSHSRRRREIVTQETREKISVAAILVTQDAAGEEEREEMDRIDISFSKDQSVWPSSSGQETPIRWPRSIKVEGSCDGEEGECEGMGPGCGIMVRVSLSALATLVTDNTDDKAPSWSPLDLGLTPYMIRTGLSWQEARVQGSGAWACAQLCLKNSLCIASIIMG